MCDGGRFPVRSGYPVTGRQHTESTNLEYPFTPAGAQWAGNALLALEEAQPVRTSAGIKAGSNRSQSDTTRGRGRFNPLHTRELFSPLRFSFRLIFYFNSRQGELSWRSSPASPICGSSRPDTLSGRVQQNHLTFGIFFVLWSGHF